LPDIAGPKPIYVADDAIVCIAGPKPNDPIAWYCRAKAQ